MAGAPLKLAVSRWASPGPSSILFNVASRLITDEQLSSQFNVHVYDTTTLAPRGFDMALPWRPSCDHDTASVPFPFLHLFFLESFIASVELHAEVWPACQ